MVAPEGAAAVRTAVLHARARWAGAAVLALGAVQTAVAAVVLVRSGQAWVDLGLSVIAMLSGLSSFGTHSDTALALLRDHRWHPDVPSVLLREMDGEVLLRRRALAALRSTPRTAWLTTGLAVVVLVCAILRTAW